MFSFNYQSFIFGYVANKYDKFWLEFRYFEFLSVLESESDKDQV